MAKRATDPIVVVFDAPQDEIVGGIRLALPENHGDGFPKEILQERKSRLEEVLTNLQHEHADNAIVRDLALDCHGNLYASGAFTAAGDVNVNRIARWDGTRWSALGEGMSVEHTASPEVWALAVDGQGNLYAGREIYATGLFFIPPDSNTFTHYIARWDGLNWNPLGKGVDNFVNALAVDPEGNLYAIGDSTSAGGITALRTARWDDMSFYLFIRPINGGYKSSSPIVCHSLSM